MELPTDSTKEDMTLLLKRNSGEGKNYDEVTNRRNGTPTGQRKRQKVIRYYEDDEKGGKRQKVQYDTTRMTKKEEENSSN